MGGREIRRMGAVDLAREIRGKKLSPVEVVSGFLERIEAINPKINAYVTLTADSARVDPRRPAPGSPDGRTAL